MGWNRWDIKDIGRVERCSNSVRQSGKAERAGGQPCIRWKKRSGRLV